MAQHYGTVLRHGITAKHYGSIGTFIFYNSAGIHDPLGAWKRLSCFKTLDCVSDTLNFIDTYASTLIMGVSSQYKMPNFLSYFQTFFFLHQLFYFYLIFSLFIQFSLYASVSFNTMTFYLFRVLIFLSYLLAQSIVFDHVKI